MTKLDIEKLTPTERQDLYRFTKRIGYGYGLGTGLFIGFLVAMEIWR
jgi:hypothetical protein